MSPKSTPMRPLDHDWYRMDSPENLMVVDGLMWTTRPVDPDLLLETLRRRMVDPFPKFAMRPRDSRIPLLARWQEDPGFDMERHVSTVRLPDPGDERELKEFVSSQISQPLDRHHPMWQVQLIEGYGPGSAVLFRIHHSIADGITLARVLLSLTDSEDAPPVDEAFEPEHQVGPVRRLAGAASSLARHGAHAVRNPDRIRQRAQDAGSMAVRLTQVTLRPVKPDSAMTGRLGVVKHALWTDALPLGELKRIAHSRGVTLNDVLFTILADSMSAYLAAAGTPLDIVRVFMPVNLRPLDRRIPRDLGNGFGLMLPPLPTGAMTITERLARVHHITDEYKDSPEALGSLLVMAAIGLTPARVEQMLNAMFASKAVATITNVPGPRSPVTLAGAPVGGIVPFVPASADIGLRTAFFTYNDQARISMVADSKVFADADRLVRGVELAFRKLAAA